jgi:hypothetical protein
MFRYVKQSIPIVIAILLVIGISMFWSQKGSKLPSAARSILEQANQIELISLDPNRSEMGKLKNGYYGWKVIGKNVIEHEEIRNSMISAVERAIAQGAPRAICFVPRHAIHASTYDGRTVDILICFQCNRVEVYVNSQRQDPDLPTSGTSEPILDKILTDASVPLAPKVGE